MIGKWIACRTAPETREAFAAGQLAWNVVAGQPGFRGQCGGFAGDDAFVLALWETDPAYRAFMDDVHDGIAAASGQANTYSSIEVDLLDRVLDMPGREVGVPTALPDASFLRVADCVVRNGRRGRFLDVQRSVWRPGMQGARGMLAGAVWSVRGRTDRLLVTTLWEDEAAHDVYRRDVLPDLRRRARPDDDLLDFVGHALPLVPGWTVPAAPSP
jgi:heme-degrading monooxygenase HmoA